MAFNIAVKCTTIEQIDEDKRDISFESITPDTGDSPCDLAMKVTLTPSDDDYDKFEEDGEYRFGVGSHPK